MMLVVALERSKPEVDDLDTRGGEDYVLYPYRPSPPPDSVARNHDVAVVQILVDQLALGKVLKTAGDFLGPRRDLAVAEPPAPAELAGDNHVAVLYSELFAIRARDNTPKQGTVRQGPRNTQRAHAERRSTHD